MKLGDFNDPKFRKWVDFRIQTFTDFMHEIDVNAKSVNPEIKTIPEIYPGIEKEAVRLARTYTACIPWSTPSLTNMNSAAATTWHPVANSAGLVRYQVGMHSFRAFAQGKATWILNYSWDGDKKVDTREAMMNLAMSQIMAGANFWDAPGHSMGGSNDLPPGRRYSPGFRRTKIHSIRRGSRFIPWEFTSLRRREITR